MLEVLNGETYTLKCHDDLCLTEHQETTPGGHVVTAFRPRQIKPGDRYFWDTLRKRQFCHPCGECLRYARKKAAARGEPIEEATL